MLRRRSNTNKTFKEIWIERMRRCNWCLEHVFRVPGFERYEHKDLDLCAQLTLDFADSTAISYDPMKDFRFRWTTRNAYGTDCPLPGTTARENETYDDETM